MVAPFTDLRDGDTENLIYLVLLGFITRPTVPASLLISMCVALVNVIVDTLAILYKAEGMEHLFHFRSLLQIQHVALLTITHFNTLLAHENCNR